MKSVNIQLDEKNSLEITQIEDNLFEVRLGMNGSISVYYMTREQLLNFDQLGAHLRIESILEED
ncbi:hypothetical protein ABE61_20710 [Lysinibacillus sphaericus]|uniref:hypothetical protein n=1 Tax=Lysinibacillus sphaericus TaxID=1421 RepID=UPI0018CE7AE3|nr:hypothetical protein [Lysinibacillus sphaericus]MBG9456383.1 hypothetical protein [Lysinibacillus sphaericus]MBG9479529.1 hypothetical protein [Lysinibacillus sphaericus]MBG9591822.1 hypothetical protein [Lysinibacillus sphaericus]